MDIVRPAGYNERRCIIRDALGLYGSIVTFGTYSTAKTLDNGLPRDEIVKALKACIVHHPALRTVVQDPESEHPQLSSVSTFDLQHHLRVLDGHDTAAASLQAFLERVHNEPLPEAHVRPKWRIYVAPCTNTQKGSSRILLAFASSHNLMDGRSGLIFHDTFVRALSTSNAKFDAGLSWTVPDSVSRLPEPLEKAGNLTISWSCLLSTAVAEFMPGPLLNLLGVRKTVADDAWCGASSRPERPDGVKLLQTAVRVVLVSASTVQKVLTVCRKHDCKLTGLLNQAFARALAHTFQPRGESHLSYATSTPIDLRSALPKTYQGMMANFVSAVSETFTVTPDRVEPRTAMNHKEWDAARTSTLRLKAASGTLADQQIALLKYLSNFRDWTLKQANNPTKTAFSISNLGNFEQVGTDWQVEQFGFSQSADATGAAIGINVASAKDGPLTVSVSWWPGMLGVSDESKFVEDVCVAFEEFLENLVADNQL